MNNNCCNPKCDVCGNGEETVQIKDLKEEVNKLRATIQAYEVLINKFESSI